MNIEQFEIFRTIAQAKSFTKAAKILNFTQPAISSQVKMLEQNFNVALFERCNTGVKLTDAGRKFYEYGERILALYAEMEREIANISGNNKEFINVGASYTAGNYFLPSSIITFKELHENVHIRLDIGHSPDIINAIKERSLDLGVVEGDYYLDKDLDAYKVQSNELVIISPPNNRWFDSRVVTLEELMQAPFIAREAESSIRHFVESYLKTQGISFDDFNIITEISNFEAIKEAVMRNKGISLVPLPVVQREIQEGHLIRLEVKGLQLAWDMRVVVRANETLTGIKEEFLQFLTDPNTMWKAESDYNQNQKMRFI
ncbi:MAG TPA: LysR family transcriptional regulator [Syntrophomonadaceae bacterium]|nr:LysR family transcriptional regulator [Syntrophomonadaceae bacterium]